MYYVHEYSDEQFETYDECQEDLYEYIVEDDISDHIDLTVPEIIHHFGMRANNQNFINWFEERIAEAERLAIDELITEYEEGEVE